MSSAQLFLDTLKRFNVKERNFLMRYALADRLSPRFLVDLTTRLREIGVAGLDGATVVCFGMDFHLEWIHAALLVGTGELTLGADGNSAPRTPVPDGRIEDVDLLVVLERADHTLVMVLIEAKGVTSFDREQLESKSKRLKVFRPELATAQPWLTPVVLLMSPLETCPRETNLNQFAMQMLDAGVWPEGVDPAQLWMELKDFYTDMPAPAEPLRISTCYADGSRASDLQARKDHPYRYWRIERRRGPG
jgi:hypothetical protein